LPDDHNQALKFNYLDFAKINPVFAGKIKSLEHWAQGYSNDTSVASSMFSLHLSLINLERAQFWFEKISREDQNYPNYCLALANARLHNLSDHQMHQPNESDPAKKAIKKHNQSRRRALIEIMKPLLKIDNCSSISKFRNTISRLYIYGTESKAQLLNAPVDPIEKIHENILVNGEVTAEFMEITLEDLRVNRRQNKK
jgi:hypothetical protein